MNSASSSAAPKADSSLRLTHFGAAGWRITDGTTVVLIDPYFSRIRYRGKAFGTANAPVAAGDTRPVYGPDDALVSDVATVDAHVEQAHYILISHSHFNHCMDTPHIARKTGAAVIGSESTINVARAGGVDEQQLYAVKGGEDYAFDTLSVKVLPSLHSALNEKRYFESATIPREVKAPVKLREYVEGGTLAYYIRLAGHRILVFGSMNFIERELQGLQPSVALIAAARARLQIHDYTARLLRAVDHPPVVIATHWDVQTAPYGASQELALEQAQSFVREVREVSPAAQVIVPRHFDTITIDRDGTAR